jgi:hypothetical protein
VIERQGFATAAAEQRGSGSAERPAEEVPQRDVDGRFGVDMSRQPGVEPGHCGFWTIKIVSDKLTGHLGDGRDDAAGIGWQVVRDRANLAPARPSRAGVDAQHNGVDGVAGLARGHVVGLMACQRDAPHGEGIDLHWRAPGSLMPHPAAIPRRGRGRSRPSPASCRARAHCAASHAGASVRGRRPAGS